MIRSITYDDTPNGFPVYRHPQPQPSALPDDVVKDAERYQRLRILGCAPMGTTHLERGLVMRFTNLDAFLDDDIKYNPSRGEPAIDAAMIKEGKV